MVKKFEDSLYNYFDEIIYVESNPATISSQITEKIDGEIKYRFNRIDYDLHSISICTQSNNLFSTECKNPGIIEKIKNLCKHTQIDFYPKSILQKIFGNKIKNLTEVLKEYDKSYYFITTSELSKYLPKDYTVNVIDCLGTNNQKRLKNKIIVAKKSKIVLNKNIEEDSKNSQLLKVEFWIDSEKFLVIDLV
jgi:hypothetical protein